jgi:phosphatidylinositol glycan class M
MVSQNAAVSSTLLWLYNPLPLIVSSRGSSDSLETFLVLLVFYCLTKRSNFLAGVIFGIAVHVKMYPMIYAIGIFFLLRKHQHERQDLNLLSLGVQGSRVHINSAPTADSTESATCNTSSLSKEDNWNTWNPLTRERISFFGAAALSFSLTTGLAYHWYGDNYLNEAWLYHFYRKDAQHNFSIYFYIYHLGLSPFVETLISRCAFIPQVLVILLVVKKYLLFNDKKLEVQLFSSDDSNSLSLEAPSEQSFLSDGLSQVEEELFAKFFFVSFCQTFMFVHLNKVITSQYFLWYLCLLPLIFPFLYRMRGKEHLKILFLWLTSQGIWLLMAYLFEYQRIQAALPFVWTASLLFLSVNLWIMKRYLSTFDATLIRKDHQE